ncbi:MAG: C-terminal binding protein [Nitrososphaeria archaeon]
MNKKFKVVIINSAHPSSDIEKEVLEEIADVRTFRCNTQEEIVEAAAGADALMCADIAHIPLTREVLSRIRHIKVISIYGVSPDSVDVRAAREYNIVVANVPDYGTSEVADHTMALALSLLRKVPMLDKALRNVGWGRTRESINYVRENFGEIRRLNTLTFGLLGFGRIARAVAERAKAFGFRVVAHDPYVSDELFLKMDVEKMSFENLLKESDVLSIHVLLTEETRHMIGEQELNKMKKGVYIVNTSRGAVFDQRALIRALQEGQVAGAALDVFEREPIESDNPLLKMENVIVTPHIAWYSEESMIDQQRKTALNVRRVLSGEHPLYPVNV